MAKKYVVNLADDERTQRLALPKRGKASARRLSPAHIIKLRYWPSCFRSSRQALNRRTKSPVHASGSADITGAGHRRGGALPRH
jgi:hypothetical protein